jgi:hypothetical protein
VTVADVRAAQLAPTIIDRLVLEPPVTALRALGDLARRMHVGNVNACAAYVLLALLFELVLGVGVF